MLSIYIYEQQTILRHKRTCAHTSTSEKTPSIRQDFYDKLDNLLQNIPNRAVLYLAGDFNAKTGSGHTIHPAIVGKYGRGQTNSNGELLLDIAQKYNLTIANTLFKHKVAHITTWTCNAKQTFPGEKNNIIRNQIDYILIRQHHKLHILDCRANNFFDIHIVNNSVLFTSYFYIFLLVVVFVFRTPPFQYSLT